MVTNCTRSLASVLSESVPTKPGFVLKSLNTEDISDVVMLFIVLNRLITGGSTRLAFFNQMAGVPVSAFILIFNHTIFLLGAWVLEKQFAVTTVLCTVIY